MFRARKQNSTGRPITFLLVSSTDHVTPQTGKSPTVTLSKDGGAFGAAAGAVSEVGNGIYALAGNATDRNTLGELVLRATATGCDDVLMPVVIVAADPFDGNLGLTNLDATVGSRAAPGAAMTLTSAYDAAKTAAQAGDAMNLQTGAITASKFATDALSAGAVSAAAVSKIVAGLATGTNVSAAEAAILAAVDTRLAADDYTAPTEPPTPPTADAIAAAVLTKKVEDVISGLTDADDHTLAFVIQLFTEAARVAGAIRVRKPDGTTWKDKTITESATQNPVESIT